MPRRLKGMPYRGKSASRGRLAQELEKARRRQATALQEVRRLEKLWNSQRPWHHCLRCGHDWQGVNPDQRPRCCAQCHSAGWQTASQSQRARRPGDAPNPAWEEQNRKKPAPKFEPIVMQESVTVPVTDNTLEIQRLIEQNAKDYERQIHAELNRALSLPAGLPPPPGATDLIHYDGPPGRPLTFHDTRVDSQMPAPPQLWQPRQPQEPQPESFARPAPAPAPVAEPEPVPEMTAAQLEALIELEAQFPRLSAADVDYADAAEAAWEESAE